MAEYCSGEIPPVRAAGVGCGQVLGYVFANELDIATRRVQDFGTALGLLIAVPVALWRGLTLARMIHHLRLRRISPPMLAQKLKANRRIAVIDLLNFEEADGQSPEAIPREAVSIVTSYKPTLQFRTLMVRLPNGNRAVVDIAKLRDYCLNSQHEDGKHKARVFAAALGLGRADAKWLRERLLEAASSQPAFVASESRFGTLYVVDFLLTTVLGSAEVRSGWIVRHSEDFPRLTTCYAKRSARL